MLQHLQQASDRSSGRSHGDDLMSWTRVATATTIVVVAAAASALIMLLIVGWWRRRQVGLFQVGRNVCSADGTTPRLQQPSLTTTLVKDMLASCFHHDILRPEFFHANTTFAGCRHIIIVRHDRNQFNTPRRCSRTAVCGGKDWLCRVAIGR